VATIVRNLLTFARQDENEHGPADITHIAEATLSLIQTIMRHDQILFTTDIPENLPEIRCRDQQIRQVLMNLLTNARDAVRQRYPDYDEDKIIRLSAALFEKEGNKWIRTTVEDHGFGINQDVKERMFDPFFTTKPRVGGAGLGLSISYGIVKEHGGELNLESVPGEYTRFHLDLPVVDKVWELDNDE